MTYELVVKFGLLILINNSYFWEFIGLMGVESNSQNPILNPSMIG